MGSISDNWYYYKPIGNVSITLKNENRAFDPKMERLEALAIAPSFTDPYTNLTPRRWMKGGGRFNFYKIVIEIVVTPVSTVNVV